MKPHITLSLLAAVSCWFSSVHAQEVQNSSPAIGVSPLQSESRSGVLELMAQPGTIFFNPDRVGVYSYRHNL